MEESFRQKLKEYFSFLKKDRNGIMVLAVLIIFSVVGRFIVDTIEIKPPANNREIIMAIEAWEKAKKEATKSLRYFPFNPNTISEAQLDSLYLPENAKKNLVKYRNAGGKFTRPSDLRKIYGMNDSSFAKIEPWVVLPDVPVPTKKTTPQHHDSPEEFAFDPNTASVDELLRLGFNRFQATNIEKYRARGGRFNRPEDVMKIYGVDSAFFSTIRKHVRLKVTEINKAEEAPAPAIRIELNSADSLDLVQLKGIGPVFASRIIKYRKLLGGFYSPRQLLEVYGFPEETYFTLKENFVADTLKVKKLRLNFAEYTELVRHPYLKREHVRSILNHRQKHGPFLKEEQLLGFGLIDSASYVKVRPYFTCR